MSGTYIRADWHAMASESDAMQGEQAKADEACASLAGARDSIRGLGSDFAAAMSDVLDLTRETKALALGKALGHYSGALMAGARNAEGADEDAMRRFSMPR